MTRRIISIGAAVLAVALIAVAATSGRLTSAQDTSATPDAMGATAHPIHIHAGTCAALGDVVFPLTDLTAPDMMASPMAETDAMASPMAGVDSMAAVVAQSETTVQADLNTIITGGHAINAHESAENIGNYIACGDITGTPTDNTLQITLQEQNDSGYQGVAMLTDNGDGTTTVLVMLMMSQDMATPTA